MNLSDYELRVQTQWKVSEYPDLSPQFFAVTGGCLACCWFIGIAMNGVVLAAFISLESLRHPFNYVLANLNFSDFLMCGFGIPLEVIASAMGGWRLPKFICNYLAFIMTLTGMASVFTLMALSIFRCILMSCPDISHYAKVRMSVFAIVIVWILALTCALPPVFGYGAYLPESSGISCTPNWFDPALFEYSWYMITIGYLFPLSMIAISSLLLYNNSKKNHKSKKTLKNVKEESVTKMIFTMLVAFMGAWTPYAISCILRMYHLNLPPHFDAIALITAKASGAINPFIFVMHDEFQDAIKMRKANRIIEPATKSLPTE